jgi:hypothetical protein
MQQHTNEYDHLTEGTWGDLNVSGAAPYHHGHPGHHGHGHHGHGHPKCRVVWQQQGQYVHGWGKLRLPGGQVVIVHASTDLAAMEREMTAEIRAKLVREAQGQQGSAVSGGWWKKFKKKLKKIKHKLKAIAKKTGVFKVLKTIHNVVEKALDNPIIKGVLASNPYGAAFLAARQAIHTGIKLVKKAVKGSKKARDLIAKVVHAAKKGHKPSVNAVEMIRKGLQAMKGLTPQQMSAIFSKAMTAAAGSHEVWDSIAAGCGCYDDNASAGYYEIMGGAEDQETDHEIEALDTFASSGAFEGLRWFVDRMGPHSMTTHPQETTARDALMLGREAYAQRFH